LLRDCGRLLARRRRWLTRNGLRGWRRWADGLLRGRLLRDCGRLLARRGRGWLTRRSVRGRRRTDGLLYHWALRRGGLLHRWSGRHLGRLLSGGPLRRNLLLHGGMRWGLWRLLHGRALWCGRRLFRAWLRLLLLLLRLPRLLMLLILSVGLRLLLSYHDGTVGRCRRTGRGQPQDGEDRRSEKKPVGLGHSYPSLRDWIRGLWWSHGFRPDNAPSHGGDVLLEWQNRDERVFFATYAHSVPWMASK
jgi:hypothetical protein